MSYKKEQIIKALRDVIFFPKSNNIIALNMVENIEIKGKKINISMGFPKLDDPSVNIVKKASIKAIKDKVDKNAEVNITAVVETKQGSLSGIKNIIAVASGKGGVGKTMVAANLAIALQKSGSKVGLLDADIYGPSIPIMFGLENEKPSVVEINGKTFIVPLKKYGISVLSIGFFVEPEKALIWRGPMASKALNQLFNDTDWGKLDYLIVDLPPGTGDIPLTLVQSYPITGVIVVTTPQQVAISDVRKAANMFQQEQIKIPMLGLIENMSYFTPAELPNNKYYIFGEGTGKQFAESLNIPFLGQIPLVQNISESGDNGSPVTLIDDLPVTKVFIKIAENLKKQTEKENI
ncbi:MAG: Mrp/NBP35 family ATP-binding protein [Bacteroidetes bacterium]|nr:Mrp/NBP35 family ATP-binding protein [Bacteroidota bacterium]